MGKRRRAPRKRGLTNENSSKREGQSILQGHDANAEISQILDKIKTEPLENQLDVLNQTNGKLDEENSGLNRVESGKQEFLINFKQEDGVKISARKRRKKSMWSQGVVPKKKKKSPIVTKDVSENSLFLHTPEVTDLDTQIQPQEFSTVGADPCTPIQPLEFSADAIDPDTPTPTFKISTVVADPDTPIQNLEFPTVQTSTFLPATPKQQTSSHKKKKTGTRKSVKNKDRTIKSSKNEGRTIKSSKKNDLNIQTLETIKSVKNTDLNIQTGETIKSRKKTDLNIQTGETILSRKKLDMNIQTGETIKSRNTQARPNKFNYDSNVDKPHLNKFVPRPKNKLVKSHKPVKRAKTKKSPISTENFTPVESVSMTIDEPGRIDFEIPKLMPDVETERENAVRRVLNKEHLDDEIFEDNDALNIVNSLANELPEEEEMVERSSVGFKTVRNIVEDRELVVVMSKLSQEEIEKWTRRRCVTSPRLLDDNFFDSSLIMSSSEDSCSTPPEPIDPDFNPYGKISAQSEIAYYSVRKRKMKKKTKNTLQIKNVKSLASKSKAINLNENQPEDTKEDEESIFDALLQIQVEPEDGALVATELSTSSKPNFKNDKRMVPKLVLKKKLAKDPIKVPRTLPIPILPKENLSQVTPPDPLQNEKARNQKPKKSKKLLVKNPSPPKTLPKCSGSKFMALMSLDYLNPKGKEPKKKRKISLTPATQSVAVENTKITLPSLTPSKAKTPQSYTKSGEDESTLPLSETPIVNSQQSLLKPAEGLDDDVQIIACVPKPKPKPLIEIDLTEDLASSPTKISNLLNKPLDFEVRNPSEALFGQPMVGQPGRSNATSNARPQASVRPQVSVKPQTCVRPLLSNSSTNPRNPVSVVPTKDYSAVVNVDGKILIIPLEALMNQQRNMVISNTLAGLTANQSGSTGSLSIANLISEQSGLPKQLTQLAQPKPIDPSIMPVIIPNSVTTISTSLQSQQSIAIAGQSKKRSNSMVPKVKRASFADKSQEQISEIHIPDHYPIPADTYDLLEAVSRTTSESSPTVVTSSGLSAITKSGLTSTLSALLNTMSSTIRKARTALPTSCSQANISTETVSSVVSTTSSLKSVMTTCPAQPNSLTSNSIKFVMSQGGLASTSQGGLASTSQGGLASTSQGGLASTSQGGLASTSQGGLASTSQGGLASTSQGGLASTSQGGLASTSQGGLASTSQGGLASTSQGGLASTSQGGLASTSQGGLASTSQGGLASASQVLASASQGGLASASQGGPASTSQGGLASASQGGLASANQGGLASASQGGLASASQGGLASASQGALASTSQGGLASTSQGGLASTSQGGLASTLQASLASTSQTSLASTSQTSLASTSQTSLASTSQASLASTSQASLALTRKAGPTPTSKAGSTPTSKAGSTPTSKAGSTPTSKAGSTPTSKADSTSTNKAGPTLANKAGPTLANKAGPTPTSKAGPFPMSKAGQSSTCITTTIVSSSFAKAQTIPPKQPLATTVVPSTFTKTASTLSLDKYSTSKSQNFTSSATTSGVHKGLPLMIPTPGFGKVTNVSMPFSLVNLTQKGPGIGILIPTSNSFQNHSPPLLMSLAPTLSTSTATIASNNEVVTGSKTTTTDSEVFGSSNTSTTSKLGTISANVVHAVNNTAGQKLLPKFIPRGSTVIQPPFLNYTGQSVNSITVNRPGGNPQNFFLSRFRTAPRIISKKSIKAPEPRCATIPVTMVTPPPNVNSTTTTSSSENTKVSSSFVPVPSSEGSSSRIAILDKNKVQGLPAITAVKKNDGPICSGNPSPMKIKDLLNTQPKQKPAVIDLTKQPEGFPTNLNQTSLPVAQTVESAASTLSILAANISKSDNNSATAKEQHIGQQRRVVSNFSNSNREVITIVDNESTNKNINNERPSTFSVVKNILGGAIFNHNLMLQKQQPRMPRSNPCPISPKNPLEISSTNHSLKFTNSTPARITTITPHIGLKNPILARQLQLPPTIQQGPSKPNTQTQMPQPVTLNSQELFQPVQMVPNQDNKQTLPENCSKPTYFIATNPSTGQPIAVSVSETSAERSQIVFKATMEGGKRVLQPFLVSANPNSSPQVVVEEQSFIIPQKPPQAANTERVLSPVKQQKPKEPIPFALTESVPQPMATSYSSSVGTSPSFKHQLKESRVVTTKTPNVISNPHTSELPIKITSVFSTRSINYNNENPDYQMINNLNPPSKQDLELDNALKKLSMRGIQLSYRPNEYINQPISEPEIKFPPGLSITCREEPLG